MPEQPHHLPCFRKMRNLLHAVKCTDDLKDGKLYDSGKQEEGKTFHNLHVLGMNDDLWDRVRGLGSETWKGCE